MTRLPIVMLTALGLAACAATADTSRTAGPPLPTVERGDIAIATMQEVTRTLSSDAFEGRAPGTAGSRWRRTSTPAPRNSPG